MVDVAAAFDGAVEARAIDDQVANSVMAQLLFLDKTGRSQDIKMYINSPGGSVTAGLAIYDTMQLIEPTIQTYCVGQAASMGAVLLAGGFNFVGAVTGTAVAKTIASGFADPAIAPLKFNSWRSLPDLKL